MSRPIARTYFYSVNFNKRSVCIDTQKEAGKKLVQRIAATADALIANLRPPPTHGRWRRRQPAADRDAYDRLRLNRTLRQTARASTRWRRR